MRRLAVPLGAGLVIVLAVAFAVVRGITQPGHVPAVLPTPAATTGWTPSQTPSPMQAPDPSPAPTAATRATPAPVIIEPEMAAPAAPAGWASTPPTSRRPAPVEPRRGPPALEVPSLAIRAPLVNAEVVAGEYAVPRDPLTVGAYRPSGGDLATRLAPRPGVLLVAGHVTVGRERGSLWPLHALAPGAELVTTGPAGTRRWKAISLAVHRADALPDHLTRSSGPEQLVVVTCTGPVVTNEGRRAYQDNLVVTAVPA